MCFREIVKRLQAGGIPEEWPEAVPIGRGLYRTAYKVGQWVVKLADENSGQSWKQPAAVIRQIAIRVSRQKQVGDYIIQPLYQPAKGAWDKDRALNPIEEQAVIDLSVGDLDFLNIGYDRRGRLTAFDW